MITAKTKSLAGKTAATALAVVFYAAILAPALVSVLASDAWPHDFYDAICCSGNAVTGDCQPVADSTVKPIDGGVQITLVPGDHHMVTRAHVFQVPQTQVRPSKDGRWHVCLYPNEDRLQCVYGPPYGS